MVRRVLGVDAPGDEVAEGHQRRVQHLLQLPPLHFTPCHWVEEEEEGKGGGTGSCQGGWGPSPPEKRLRTKKMRLTTMEKAPTKSSKPSPPSPLSYRYEAWVPFLLAVLLQAHACPFSVPGSRS